MCSSYVTVERLETNTTFELGRCQFMMIHWTEKKRNISKIIEHKTETNNIFRKKEKPNKKQNELA